MTATTSTTQVLLNREAPRAASTPSPPRSKRTSSWRISVEGGGCSGFQYKFDLVSDREADDLVIEQDGATVVIDPVSLGFLTGSEI